MAIDTVNEQLALIHFGAVFQPPVPISPSTLGQDDQQQLLWGYPGILWGVSALADSPLNFHLLAPEFDPGPPIRVGGGFDPKVDRDFQILARLANVSHYLTDVQQWMGDEGIETEIVDLFTGEGLEPDSELFGRRRRGD